MLKTRACVTRLCSRKTGFYEGELNNALAVCDGQHSVLWGISVWDSGCGNPLHEVATMLAHIGVNGIGDRVDMVLKERMEVCKEACAR